MELTKRIKEKVDLMYDDMFNIYCYLHQHPELSFEEEHTSKYIESILVSLGIEFRKNIGGYGILAWIEGRNPLSKIIALRADMDALPIEEANDIPYKSINKGVMHACGHDVHVTSLLSAVKIVKEMQESLVGTVLFIFQPGEEKHPGGASLMLADGLFNTYNPDLIVAQHVYVDYPVGVVGFEPGVVMASADEIHMKIKGKGGHGAIPHELNDTVLAASQVVVSLQQVVSRRSNPFSPMVLSIGKFIANGATNVIPNEVVLAGSLRCMDEGERMKVKPIIRDIAISTARAYGCECEIEVYDGYPCTINDDDVTFRMKEMAIEFLGDSKVLGLPKRMTSEDFGFFSQRYPSTFYRVGIQGSQMCTGLHTPNFLIDPEALKTSSGLLAYLALKYCS